MRHFQNTDAVTKSLMELHGVPAKHRPNVMKQAEQLRLCLSLARDYFQAAQGVSLGTRPVLLYYSVMHLALAEILFKQSGDSSIDKARAEHRHHGLQSTVGAVQPNQAFEVSGSLLTAKPMYDHSRSGRFGTFELWHRSAGHLPAYGLLNDTNRGITSKRCLSIVYGGEMEEFPSSGMTLLDCMKRIPCLLYSLDQKGIDVELVRGRSDAIVNGDDFESVTTIHPTREALLNEYLENYLVPPALVPSIDVQQGASTTAVIRLKLKVGYPSGCRIPHVMVDEDGQNYFQPSELPLNEFGYFYVALFIAGNYARYYPDLWVKDIEASSELSFFIEVLVGATKTCFGWGGVRGLHLAAVGLTQARCVAHSYRRVAQFRDGRALLVEAGSCAVQTVGD